MDDKKKKAAQEAEKVKELTPDDLAGAQGGESEFGNVPRVDEHPYQEGEKPNL
jgi:hypothetical protein